MSFSALIVQILISSPSDLPQEHRDVIARTIRRWNNQHSRFYGIQYSPTDSHEGGAPAFGEYAQDVLNSQIVDESDMVLAIFTDRLGTPTPDHESGTAEEINRGLEQKKDVAVLQNDCQRAPVRSSDADEQRSSLNAFLKSLQSKAFIQQYDSTARLAEIVEQLLSLLARKYRNEASTALVGGIENSGAPASLIDEASKVPAIDDQGEIWPRVEVENGVRTDSRGRVRSTKRWYLVLESTLRYPARNVRFRYVDAHGNPVMDFDLRSDRHDAVDVLPPGGSVRFPILQAMGSPDMTQCVVEWDDPDGQTRSTTSTVRTV